jgi:hypothetical protein
MNRLRVAAIVFSLLVLFCFQGAGADSNEGILSLLPEATKIAGWKCFGESVLYQDEALFDYLNGGAETFFDYGFTQALVQEYSRGAARIILDIYEMSSPNGARGIFQKRTSTDYQRLSIGEEGRLGDYYLIFYKGPFFVAVTGLSMEPGVIEGIESIARAVAERIP